MQVSTAAELLQLNQINLHFSKRGQPDLHVLKDISMIIRQGECCGLVGASGCGKSTLARLLCLLHRPDSGLARLAGQDIFSYQEKNYYQQVQMVFQDPLACFPARMKVANFLLEPFRNFMRPEYARKRHFAAELLQNVSLTEDFLERYPNQLSGGQLQRIVFARAVGLNPALLICDEATSALDVTIQAQIIDLLRGLQQQQGFGCLFITHDLALAEDLCDTIHVMDDGAIVETLSSGNIASEAQHWVTRRMIDATCQDRPNSLVA